jgi:hypothetical protein
MGYLNLVGGFVYKDPVFRAKLDALAENDAYLKDNGWQTSTKAIFFQAAAPTGWTKDTTHNGKVLRIVNGVSGGSAGGTTDISGTITMAHTSHSIQSELDHTHAPASSHSHDFAIQAPNNRTGNVGYLIGSGNTPMRTAATSGAVAQQTLLPVLDSFSTGTGDTYDASSSSGAHGHGNATLTAALTDTAFKYVDVIVASKDTSAGYTNMTSAFVSGNEITYQDLASLAANDAFLYARLMPAGSVMPFGQTTAPTGWTKSTTHDDKALRAVSGTGGGNGGTTGFGSSVALSHSHTTSSDGSHTHVMGNHRHHVRTFARTIGANDGGYVSYDGSDNLQATVGGSASTRTAVNGRTANDGGGGTTTDLFGVAHTHSIGSALAAFQFAYLDVILCSKDSAGSSSVYTNMTSVWVFKILVSKQRLNKMGANDDYIKFHTVESGSQSFFSQVSAPLNWTKITTYDDKALRVVSGGSGGSVGGSNSISSPIPLAHTHTISSQSHSHNTPSHQHYLETYSETNAGALGNLVTTSVSAIQGLQESSAAFTEAFVAKRYSKTDGNGSTDSASHNHFGGVTGSLLTDVQFAYKDVIYCSKD